MNYVGSGGGRGEGGGGGKEEEQKGRGVGSGLCVEEIRVSGSEATVDEELVYLMIVFL